MEDKLTCKIPSQWIRPTDPADELRHRRVVGLGTIHGSDVLEKVHLEESAVAGPAVKSDWVGWLVGGDRGGGGGGGGGRSSDLDVDHAVS